MDSDEQARALIGTIVADKYRVLEVLGAGGMGTVYMAEHVFTKRRVALKRMHPELGRSKQAAERFIRESQAPSTIGHPGIVQVLDGGSQSDGTLYIVHELLEGVSMSEAVARNTLTASAVVQLGVELLQALAAAHEKGIIHRDIKPDNVFIAQDGRGGVAIKLLDFGIASLRDTSDGDKLTRPGSVLGTAQYMSPEQATGASVDERSDLWSVGALLYHALAGVLPYPGDTFSAVIYALASKQHVPLAVRRPDLPEALVEVVERSLRKPADERFASAAEMCADLAAVSFDGAERAANGGPLQDSVGGVVPGAAVGFDDGERAASSKRHQDSVGEGVPGGAVSFDGAGRGARSKRRRDSAGEAVPVSVSSAHMPLRAAARAVQAAAVQHSHPAAVVVSRAPARSASTSASVKIAVVAGSVMLCALTWSLLHQRASEPRVAVGRLSAADGVLSAPSAGSGEMRAMGRLSAADGVVSGPSVGGGEMRAMEQLSAADGVVGAPSVGGGETRVEGRLPAADGVVGGPSVGGGEMRAEGQLPAADDVSASLARGARGQQPSRLSVSRPLSAAPQGLPMSALAPVLASRQAQLERCLQEAVVSQLLVAAADSVWAYRLDVSLSVAASGQVESAEFSGDAPAALLGCLRAELLAATFPRAVEPTVFRYPLVLTPTVLGQADRPAQLR